MLLWPEKGEQSRCACCGNRDRNTLGYLAAEQARESCRAVVCDGCHGYLKSVASLGPMGPAGLILHGLRSLELDIAALQLGYGRPDGLGFDLDVSIPPGPFCSLLLQALEAAEGQTRRRKRDRGRDRLGDSGSPDRWHGTDDAEYACTCYLPPP